MDIKEEKVPQTIEELRECCDHIEVTVPVMFHGEACPQCGIYKEKKTGEYVVYFGMPSGGAYSEKNIFKDEDRAVAELYRRLKEHYEGILSERRFNERLKKYSPEQIMDNNIKLTDPFYQMDLAKKAQDRSVEKIDTPKASPSSPKAPSQTHTDEISCTTSDKSNNIFDTIRNIFS